MAQGAEFKMVLSASLFDST